jgi:hypothetical protein
MKETAQAVAVESPKTGPLAAGSSHGRCPGTRGTRRVLLRAGLRIGFPAFDPGARPGGSRRGRRVAAAIIQVDRAQSVASQEYRRI